MGNHNQAPRLSEEELAQEEVLGIFGRAVNVINETFGTLPPPPGWHEVPPRDLPPAPEQFDTTGEA